MNYLDAILLVPLAWGAVRGFMRGFIIELASILALLLGVFGAIRFSHYTESLIREQASVDESYLPLVAFGVTFLLIVIAVHLLAKVLKRVVKFVALGWADRFAGGVFGFAKLALITSFVLVFLSSVGGGQWNPIRPEVQRGSLLFGPVASIGPFVLPFVTESSWYREVSWEDVEVLPSDTLEETVED